MRARTFLSASSLALALGACGGDDGGTADAGIDAMLGDPTVRVGYFNVDLKDSDPDYTTVDARVYDKAVPEAVIWTTMATDGDCQLQIPSVPFCSTPCTSSQVCVATDTCVANVVSQEVGGVHVSGVHTTTGDSEFDLVKSIPTVAYYTVPASISLAYPGFAAGDAVTFSTPGSSFTPAFTVTAPGIAPLVVTNPEPALARNAALDLTWTPPTGTATTRLKLKLDISHHGGSKGKIVCDTADDGSLTMSASMMTQLLDLGAAGFPTIELTRVSTGSGLTTAGRVDLTISSMISQPVTVPGVISCNDDSMCTPPATCQSDLTCR